MTSSGNRSPVRIPANLAVLIFAAVLVLLPVCVQADSAFGSSEPSARIQALGSHFSWIIPDQLTDLTLNPARAWDAESLTINYSIRNSNTYSLPFPVVQGNTIPDFYNLNISGANEIRLFGAGAWGWKWAMATRWRLDHEDGCNQTGTDPLDRSSNGDIWLEMSENCDIIDNNYIHFDIASARRLGAGTVLGLRAGGSFRYYDRKSRDRYTTDVYEYDSDTGQYLSDFGRSRDILNDTVRKLFAGYLEAGMTWEESGELVIRGGYAEGAFIMDDYSLRVETGYDRYTGELEDYSYSLEEWRENRDGDSWLLSVSAKKRYSGGFVIAASGRYERGSYESDKIQGYTKYSWGGYNDLQILDQLRIIGEGVRSRSEAIFSLGKTYSLEQRIDLTPGAYVAYRRNKFEEDGEAHIISYIDESGTISSLQSAFPASFQRTQSHTSLVLPIAIEFRAASFFRLYSGFGLKFLWNRSSRKSSILLDQSGLETSSIASELETEGNQFDTAYSITLGFSLRYREKLFFDMYTESTIVPQNVGSYLFDLRYVF